MIPKIVHHCWTSDNNFKEKYYDLRLSWMKYNPDYTFMFWDLKNAPYGLMLPGSVGILKSDAVYIAKSDIIRWEILRIFGGIVVDCDVECKRNFNYLLDCYSFCGKSWGDNYQGNAVVGSCPNNRMCVDILSDTTDAMARNWKLTNSRETYKCGILQAVPHLAKCEKIYPREYFYPFSWEAVDHNLRDVLEKDYPDAYAIHWWSGMHQDGWCKELEKKDAQTII